MVTTAKSCSLDRRPWPSRAAGTVTRPLAGYVSRQAAHPHGLVGRALGRLWVSETAQVNDAAVTLLAPEAGEQVLEVGFGPGRTLGLLANQGALVTGVEVSRAMISLATHRNASLVEAETVSLYEGDGTTLPLPDDTYDAVVSVHNVYFWPEPQRTIDEIDRVLRPGGRVVLAFRGGEHPLPRRLDPAVYRTVTSAEAITWLEQAGFTDVAAHQPPGLPKTLAFLTGTST
jgi:ubiquinone/menaquinone biosynthesis C-methylase UbiE